MKFSIYLIFCVSTLLELTGHEVHGAMKQVPGPDTTGKDLDTMYVAYGKVSKKELSYSVSAISAVDVSKSSAYTLGNALFGKLPGLTVIQRGGEPGNDAPSIFLRGRSTTKTNTPLVLVDGIERDMNDVSLEDVEGISVLKDAASAVMYGIRGANGVVLVTTKRGKPGRLTINGKVEQSLMTPTRIPDFLGSADFVNLYNQALANDGFAPQYSADQLAGYEQGDPYYYPDVNWNKEVTNRFASGTKGSFDVSGGDQRASYYVSLGYFNQGGLYRNTDMNEGYSTNVSLQNVSFRSNLDLHVNKNWVFNLDLGGRVYQKNAPSTETATIYEVIYKYPSHLFPVYVEDGVYGGTSIYPNNPVGYVNSKGYRTTNSRAILFTLSTTYDFSELLNGLSAGLRYSTDNLYDNEEGYTRDFGVRELLGQGSDGNPILSPLIGNNTNIEPFGPKNDVQSRRNTFEGLLTYHTHFAEGHRLAAELVYHQDRLVVNAASPNAYQFVSGQVNYDWRGRYFAGVGASYSGTEAFPKGHRFGFFPSISAAWMLSEESFLKENHWLDYLKLRVSAGMLGNAAVDERFSDRRQYVVGSGYYLGNANAAQDGLYEGVIANGDFTWESSYKYDAGFDSRLWGKADLSMTFFFEKRKNILAPGSALVPGIFGGTLPNLNAGVTHNKGLEGAVSFQDKKGFWGYQVGLNVSYATDKVQYLPEAAQPYDYLYRTGQRIGQPFMLEAIGLFNSEEEIENSPLQTFGAVQPGDIKYKDQNGDNRIDSYDEVPLKHGTLPTWDAGLMISVSFKGFDIAAGLQGQAGRSLYLGSEPLLFWPLTNNGSKISTYGKQFWTEENKSTADQPRLTTQENNNNYRESSFWYVNGDFLRLRSLELGYRFPERLTKQARLRNARLFLRAMNLFTADHLGYTDPEVMSGYPVMKSYNAGLSLQF